MEVKRGVTVSGDLIRHVRHIYEMALEDIASGKVVRRGINGYTHHALPAYVVSVAAVAAFINEAFLSFVAQGFLKGLPLWNLPKDWLEKVELSHKLVLVPLLLFGQSFPRDSQPYQDMALLIKIRNDFVHYKMQGEPPRYLKPLDDRRISLSAPTKDQYIDYVWPHKLSTSEGIRWAHNTACEVVQATVCFVTLEHYRRLLGSSADSFSPISDSYARDWLLARGIDPDSDHP